MESESQRVLREKDKRREKQKASVSLCNEEDSLYCLWDAQVWRGVPGVAVKRLKSTHSLVSDPMSGSRIIRSLQVHDQAELKAEIRREMQKLRSS